MTAWFLLALPIVCLQKYSLKGPVDFQIFLSEPSFQKHRTVYFVPLTVLKDIVAGRETVAEKGTQGKSLMLSSKTRHGMGSEQCSGGIPGGNK